MTVGMRNEEWVLWLDADVSDYPASMLQTCVRGKRMAGAVGTPPMAHLHPQISPFTPPPTPPRRSMLKTGKDIIAPHVVMPEGRTYDLNTWVETPESLKMQVGPDGAGGRALLLLQRRPWTTAGRPSRLLFWPPAAPQARLPPGKALFEGYPMMKTYRKHLDDFADQPLVKVDGVGGAVLLVRGEAHRRGLIFPPFGTAACAAVLGTRAPVARLGPWRACSQHPLFWPLLPSQCLSISSRRRASARWPSPWATSPTACRSCW